MRPARVEAPAQQIDKFGFDMTGEAQQGGSMVDHTVTEANLRSPAKKSICSRAAVRHELPVGVPVTFRRTFAKTAACHNTSF